MEPAQQKFHFRLNMGSEENAGNMLLKVQGVIGLGKEDVEAVSNQINSSTDPQGGLIMRIQFGCEVGRQQQCVKFINEGIKANDENTGVQKLTPLQALFHSPPVESSSLNIQHQKGKVIVSYKFGANEFQGFQEQVLFLWAQQFQGIINLRSELWGQVAHNNQNRTNVKVDYSYVELNSQKSIVANLSKSVCKMFNDLQDSSGQPDIFTLSLFNMVGKLKKAEVNIHTNSWRRILNFYERASSQDLKVKHTNKDFPYTVPGMLKSYANFSLIFMDRFAINLNINYHSEEVFLRLLKVYRQFLSKGFDLDVV